MHRNAASGGLRPEWDFRWPGRRGRGWAGRRRSPLKSRGPPVAVSGASRRTAIGPPCAPSRVLWGRFVEPHRTLGVFFLSRGRGLVRVEKVWVTERHVQLLTVDPSARASMKNAANCDT